MKFGVLGGSKTIPIHAFCPGIIVNSVCQKLRQRIQGTQSVSKANSTFNERAFSPELILCVCVYTHTHTHTHTHTYIYIYIYIFGYAMASLIAQLVKNLPALQETLVQFLGQEDPLEEG